jgi:hypothetical protein
VFGHGYIRDGLEKHKPQGTAGIRYPPKGHYTTAGISGVRREEGGDPALRVEPSLEDKGSGDLVDDVAAGVAI